MPCLAASRQSASPASTDRAPSSPEGRRGSGRRRSRSRLHASGRREVRRCSARRYRRSSGATVCSSRSARLEPADALAGDAELGADLFEGPRHLAVEAEASSSTWRMRSFGEASASFSSTLRRSSARTVSGCSAFLVLEHVAVHGVAVADRRLEADGILGGRRARCTRLSSIPLSAAISSGSGSRFSFCVSTRRRA